jgi:hypothetical protein
LPHLIPSIHDFYADGPDVSKKGVIWEKMFCAALVARHRVLCWEDGVLMTTPQMLSKVLHRHEAPFNQVQVTFSGGIVSSEDRVALASDPVQQTIRANWNASATAHHDFIIGVERVAANTVASGQTALPVGPDNWAGCAKAGEPKSQSVLHNSQQCFSRKKTKEEKDTNATDDQLEATHPLVPVLLQACRYDESIKQLIKDPPLKKLNDMERYAVVDVRDVIPQYTPLFHAFSGTAKSK